MHIGWAFEAAALRYPHAIGIDDGQRRFSYGEWYLRVRRIAGWLQQQGVRPGDRVGLCMRNSEDLASTYLAVQLGGATAVPINFRLGAEEISYCFTDSGAALLIHDDAVAGSLHHVRAPARTFHVRELRSLPEVPLQSPPNDDSAISVILYTSGTTGRPKGVPRSHRAEYAATIAHIVQCRYRTAESTLGVQTLAHTMGIRSLLSMVFVNGVYVPAVSLTDGSGLELLKTCRVSSLYLVPTAYHILLEQMAASRTELPDCRNIAYAGAAMTPGLVARCAAAFDPLLFANHYGSTEIYTFTISSRQREKPGCAGRPGIHGRIHVVEATRERRVTPDAVIQPGETGEVIASLDNDEAFRGYLNRPDANAAAIRQGWYFTGDLGRIDADGDLWIEGRVDDMIITGGENVYPIEVEDVLARHPAILEAVVCGLPDERWGQVVTAFVVCRPGVSLTGDEVIQYSRQRLAGHRRVRRVVFVREIPKNPVGKVLRRQILAGEYRPADS